MFHPTIRWWSCDQGRQGIGIVSHLSLPLRTHLFCSGLREQDLLCRLTGRSRMPAQSLKLIVQNHLILQLFKCSTNTNLITSAKSRGGVCFVWLVTDVLATYGVCIPAVYSSCINLQHLRTFPPKRPSTSGGPGSYLAVRSQARDRLLNWCNTLRTGVIFSVAFLVVEQHVREEQPQAQAQNKQYNCEKLCEQWESCFSSYCYLFSILFQPS